MNKYLNYWGLIFVIVILIPNIVFVITCKDGFENQYQNKLVESLEQIGRFGCFFSMFLIIPFMNSGYWFKQGKTVYAQLRVSCCGHRTMLLYGLPGLPFLQAPVVSSLPVLPRSCPVSPGPFPAFPRRVPLLPVLSGTYPFCSRPSRRSPPAPVPCRYPAARPLHPPASCGQRDGFCGCPLETCRFWTSGHHGPKDCPDRYPRP